MTAQGPKAGPLSTEGPQVGSVSASPLMRESRPLQQMPGGLMSTPKDRLRSISPQATPLAFRENTGLLWENLQTGERVIWRMAGPVYTGESERFHVPLPWRIAGAGDLDGDGHDDLVWQNTTTGDRYIWFMEDTEQRQSVLLGQVDPAWHIAAVGDMNADGMADLVWQNATTGDRYIWLMNGSQMIQSLAVGQVAPVWDIAGIGDFNDDGRGDLVWQNTTTGERYIWLMNIAQATASIALPQVDPAWDIAGVANFHAGGRTDILWQHRPSGWRAIWEMNGAEWTGSGTVLPVVDPQWNLVGPFGMVPETEEPPPTPGPLEGIWSYNATLSGTVGGVAVNCTLANMTLFVDHDDEDVSIIGGAGLGGTWHCGEPEGPTPISGFNALTGTYDETDNAVTFSIGGPALWTVTNTGTAAADLNTITGTAQLSIPLGAGSVALTGAFTATRVTFEGGSADAAARRISGVPTIPSGADLTAQTRATRDVLTAGIEKAVARAEGQLR
ncbi:MAG: VCBS repeat-containing protein [Gemmatimonadetes bacterium]|jgi:hypothetical protein|nr:VCBS repeat-containing protein [Gemmatimonadota bacterium]